MSYKVRNLEKPGLLGTCEKGYVAEILYRPPLGAKIAKVLNPEAGLLMVASLSDDDEAMLYVVCFTEQSRKKDVEAATNILRREPYSVFTQKSWGLLDN